MPSLHADTLNPNINFKDSPFYVQTELSEWVCPGPYPRRIGVSSFGAGGSNAHLILEEHRGTENAEKPTSFLSNEIFVLSARNKDALLRYTKKTRDFLADTPDLCLTDLAYTSQVGRTPMQSRLVVVTSSLEDLVAKLNQWIALREMEGTETSSSSSQRIERHFRRQRHGFAARRRQSDCRAGRKSLPPGSCCERRSGKNSEALDSGCRN